MSERSPILTTDSPDLAEACVRFLEEQGIPAEVIPVATENTSSLGLAQTPEHIVSVDSEHTARAVMLLQAAQQALQAQPVQIDVEINQLKGPVKATCDRCGQTTTFPGTMDGTTQECPQCFAFMDVGTLPEWEDWNVIDVEEAASESSKEEDTDQ